MYNIDSLPGLIELGHLNEKGVCEIEFDVTGWLTDYPAGVLSITYIRPGETTVYPADGLSVDEGILTWTVSNAVTAIAGSGSVVIALTEGETIVKKSDKVQTIVMDGHAAAGVAPEPLASYIDKWGAVDVDLTEKALGEVLTQSVTQDETGTHFDLEVHIGVGEQGPAGPAGSAGPQGIQGVAGAAGSAGADAYVHIKYSATEPDKNADTTDIPSAWMGVYSGTSATAPVNYTDYDWYNIKGATGSTGAAGADGATPVADVDYPSITTVEADVDDSIQDALADYVAVSDVAGDFTCDIDGKKAINFAFTIADTDAKEVIFTNEPTGRCEVFLEITTSAAPGAITWTLDGGSVAWSTGSAPTMVTGKTYRIAFLTSDSGTNWDAFASVGV